MKEHSFEKILKSQACLSSLGNIRHRSLFGGYSLSVDNTVFAMVSEGELYLRACEEAAVYFCGDKPEMLEINKHGRPVELQYFRVDEQLWDNPETLLTLSRESLFSARREKCARIACQRIKDLPNLTLRLEMLLNQVGVSDVHTLRTLGARACWLKLRARYRSLNVRILYALEGAISGVHIEALPAERRRELKEWWLLQQSMAVTLGSDSPADAGAKFQVTE